MQLWTTDAGVCRQYPPLPKKPPVSPVTQVKVLGWMKGKWWNGDDAQRSDCARSCDWLSLVRVHSVPLLSGTEIAGMLPVLNKCKRVKGSAVARREQDREGATENSRGSSAGFTLSWNQTKHTDRQNKGLKAGSWRLLIFCEYRLIPWICGTGW